MMCGFILPTHYHLPTKPDNDKFPENKILIDLLLFYFFGFRWPSFRHCWKVFLTVIQSLRSCVEDKLTVCLWTLNSIPLISEFLVQFHMILINIIALKYNLSWIKFITIFSHYSFDYFLNNINFKGNLFYVSKICHGNFQRDYIASF